MTVASPFVHDLPKEPALSDQPGVENRNVNVQINVSDEAKHGEYSNFFVSRVTQNEFVLDFCQLLPSADPDTIQADVVSRIYMTPASAAQLVNTMNQRFQEFQQRTAQAQAAAAAQSNASPLQ